MGINVGSLVVGADVGFRVDGVAVGIAVVGAKVGRAVVTAGANVGGAVLIETVVAAAGTPLSLSAWLTPPTKASSSSADSKRVLPSVILAFTRYSIAVEPCNLRPGLSYMLTLTIAGLQPFARDGTES